MSNEPPIFSAFTSKANGPARSVVTGIAIGIPFSIADKPLPEFPEITKYSAIWDTGATGSVITKSLVDQLGLIPIGKKLIITAGGQVEKNEYLVSIFLPNKVAIGTVAVTEVDELSGNSEVLIGMDVISMGDFSITNADGRTQVSFRIPSIAHIDYVKEADSINREIKQAKYSRGKENKIKKVRSKNKSARRARKKNRR